jgi:FimV-like protein
MVLYVAGSLFTIWMAIETVRRGQTCPWLWIVLVFGPIGSAVYFFAEYLGPASLRWRACSNRVTRGDLKVAELEVRRLDNSQAWANYAQALRLRHELPAAADAARTAVQKDGENPHALFELGQSGLSQGQYVETAQALEKLIEIDGSHEPAGAKYALAEAYHKSGNPESARAVLEEVAKTSSLPKVLYSLAELQVACGRSDEARQSLHRIIDEAEYVPAYYKKSEIRGWVRQARKKIRQLEKTGASA